MTTPTFGEICQPREGESIRFCTTTSLSDDVKTHGIYGVYRNGRFWSRDMADNWMPHEITHWQRTEA
jgi:hypothetical protein